MVGPIFSREREWIDSHYRDFDNLPTKNQIVILRRARRKLAAEDAMRQRIREAENPQPKRR